MKLENLQQSVVISLPVRQIIVRYNSKHLWTSLQVMLSYVISNINNLWSIVISYKCIYICTVITIV